MILYAYNYAIPIGAKLGMMDAYEYDYDKVDDVIEDLHDRVGSPAQVNLTALTERGKVVYCNTNWIQ